MSAPAHRELTLQLPAAGIADLRRVLATVAEACDLVAAPVAVQADLRLAVEEAFTNIVTHGYAPGAPGPVWVRVRASSEAVEVVLEDEAPAFRPADVAPPPLADDWRDRAVGGLGWHLVRQVMDEVRHAPRTPGGNTLTLVKRLPAGVS